MRCGVCGVCTATPAYIAFDKPELGINKQEFKKMVLKLGIVVSDAQMDVIMKHFDKNSMWMPTTML